MSISRRDFLEVVVSGTLASLHGSVLLAGQAPMRDGDELKADVAVIGAGLGGCAAALALLQSGFQVVMTDPTDWIGGQLTQQAVPPDEHPWIEQFGCTRRYRSLRRAIRDYYRQWAPLTEAARRQEYLNPGNGRVSRLCHEPRVALAVLEAMLWPYLASGQLRLLLECQSCQADSAGDSVRAVAVRRESDKKVVWLKASYFLDATEQGDLLPLTGTEYITGFESQRETGEPHAPAQAQPHNIQAFTYCFVMDYHPEENHVIERPDEYEFWRRYVPQLTPPWPGPLLSWHMTDPIRLEPRQVYFDPTGQSKLPGLNLWTYRRIADRNHFLPGSYRSDLTLVNWPQNDYWLGRIHEIEESEAQKHLRRAKQLSLSLLYWLQTEAPRPDGGTGWPGLRLRPDIVGTQDGLAKHPYIRESRRIRAVFTVREQHVGTDARRQLFSGKTGTLTAEPFFDSVGIGSYRIDLHPSTGGNNYIDISSLPFQIPLGALLPVRVRNLLPACKNLGVTHITNGCYRLHPVEWNTGEAAGLLAAFCLRKRGVPHAVREKRTLLAEFQKLLVREGIELEWPKLSPR